MTRITELPPEVIIEIIKHLPQGHIASQYSKSPPDWEDRTITAVDMDNNDNDQLQLYQVMRVNRLFRDCVLQYLQTPKQWPWYLSVENGTDGTATCLAQQAAQAVEREGDCFERIKIRATNFQLGELLSRSRRLFDRCVSIRADLRSKAEYDRIRKSLSDVIILKQQLYQERTTLEKASTPHRKGNVMPAAAFLLHWEHDLMRTEFRLHKTTFDLVVSSSKRRLSFIGLKYDLK